MYDHVELFFGQKVRLKTKGDSPFLGEKTRHCLVDGNGAYYFLPDTRELLSCLLCSYIDGKCLRFVLKVASYLLLSKPSLLRREKSGRGDEAKLIQ